MPRPADVLPHRPPFDPIVLLSYLAGRTERIGFVPTVSTSFEEPYNLARRIASLDHLSHGRAAWNVVTSHDAAAAQNFGAGELAGRLERRLLRWKVPMKQAPSEI